MKLIKINTDYYVIVDDSEIKDYDWSRFDYSDFSEMPNVITHSTQPLEYSSKIGKYWNKVQPVSLSEVKELIGEVDVEKKAELYVWGGVYLSEQEKQQTEIAYMTGYNQALEDNKDKKYTEEDLRMAYKEGAKSQRFNAHLDGSEKTIDETIQSLQPKTEWEVTFDEQGKLRLV